MLMKDLAVFRRFSLALLLMLLSSLLGASDVCGQTDPSPSPLRLYIEENSRLKKQQTTLLEENAALKQALEAERQKSAQLQAKLDQMQPTIVERDRQLAELTATLNTTNRKISRYALLSTGLACTIVFLLLGFLAYYQRAALHKHLLRFMEQKKRAHGQNPTPVRKTGGYIDENSIRPEELFERLYGRRHV
jgi:predicted PurR-regulated permease PerM